MQWDVEQLFHSPSYFRRAVWEEMGWPLNALTWVEDSFFDWMTAIDGYDPAKDVILRCGLMFRGGGKSTGITIVNSLHEVFRDNNRKALIISQSEKDAKKSGHAIRSALDRCSFLRHLRPRKGQRDNMLSFDVHGCDINRQPSFVILGIGGQLEGNRAHTIYPDDIETKGTCETIEARERLRNLTTEFTNILYGNEDENKARPRVDPLKILASQTPKHEQSLVLEYRKRGFQIIGVPIAYPNDDEPTLNLAPFLRDKVDRGEAKPGEPVCPERFGPQQIAVKRAAGRRNWLLEMMMAVQIQDMVKYPLRLEDLIIYDVPRPPAGKLLPLTLSYGKNNHNGSTKLDIECMGFEGDGLYGPVYIDTQWGPATRRVAALDPAGRGTDKSGFSIGCSAGGMIFVQKCTGLPGGFDEAALEPVVLACREYHVRELVFETNIDIAGTCQQTLERIMRRLRLEPGQHADYPEGWSCTVTPVRNVTRKEERILSVLEPLFGAHRVVFDREAIKVTDFDDPHNNIQFQIVNLTRDRNCLGEDGAIDSLAMMCEALSSVNRLETAQMKRKTQDREMEQLRQDRVKYQAELWGKKQKPLTTALRNF